MSLDLGTAIRQSLTDCNAILDLGAGTGHWLSSFNANKTAVELNKKYNSDLKKNGYSTIINEDIRHFCPAFNYDAIILIDVIEHLEEDDALHQLENWENSFDKVMLVFTPHEFQDNKHNAEKLGEPLQEHKSCFPKEFWLKRGYEVVLETYNAQDKVHNNLYMKRK